MDAFLQDVQYSVRRLLRAPGFALVAIATIGLGIGANTAIFSFINAALFKSPAGVSEPDRLVSVFTSDFSGPLYSTSSYPDFEELRKERDLFTDVAAISANAINLVRGSQVERLNAELVTANYFSLLGLRPAAGRLLVSGDSLQPVIVLSEATWTERFGRDAALIGGPVTVNGQSYTLVGVAPTNFHGMTTGARYEAWLPITSANHIARVGAGERDSR
ncbi:MAG TPA: ABC transporter permease, partial [Longimicrobiales bacterium]|nr:ABC transporter permease [Longimicrobiales bacterium]